MSNTVFITPDGIRWEDYGITVIAVEHDTCETIGEFWSDPEIDMEWFDDDES